MLESRAGVRASETSFVFTFPAWRTQYYGGGVPVVVVDRCRSALTLTTQYYKYSILRTHTYTQAQQQKRVTYTHSVASEIFTRFSVNERPG
eukprot:scaffold18804_cov101-Isochrysis_galbana.AAC.3